MASDARTRRKLRRAARRYLASMMFPIQYRSPFCKYLDGSEVRQMKRNGSTGRAVDAAMDPIVPDLVRCDVVSKWLDQEVRIMRDANRSHNNLTHSAVETIVDELWAGHG